MSQSQNVNVLTRLLSCLPGVAFCARMTPATGKAEWLYLDDRAAALYRLPLAEILADPDALPERMQPDDRAALRAQIAHSVETGAPVVHLGRLDLANGELRWLETQGTADREADGTVLWYGQVLDVTERKRIEQSQRVTEEAQSQLNTLYRAVIDALPVGVIVLGATGKFAIFNTAQEEMSGQAPDADGANLAETFGLFLPDGRTPFPNDELPLFRALQGEEVPEAEMLQRNVAREEERRLLMKCRPLRNAAGEITGALAVSEDVTRARRLEQQLRSLNEELGASETAKAGLIERLRYSIDELSTPILEVWDDVLVMPIIGVVDSRRTADMVQRLLVEVTRVQASFVIVDLTGVEIVDTQTADHLMKLMRKVEIVGARCVLTGIRPAVAETLVDIGVDFGRLVTLRNLKHGLREALRAAQRNRLEDEELDLFEDAEAPAQPRPVG